MQKTKMKHLALAVSAAIGGVGVMSGAQAVNVSDDGLGQALIFPYYTVQDGWQTTLNVTNTSANTVAVKVRFHEAENSRDVMDFVVVLSPFDVWHAWVDAGADGPVLKTADKSCTVPAIPEAGAPFPGLMAYTGEAADTGPTGPERMNEGYVVMTMMGTSDPLVPTNNFAQAAVHSDVGGNEGVPADCKLLQNAFAGELEPIRFLDMAPQFGYEGNPLKGTYTFMNFESGINTGGNAVALANFYDPNPSRRKAGGFTFAPNLLTMQVPPNDVPDAVAVTKAGYGYDPRPADDLDTLRFRASFHEPTLNSGNTAGRVLVQNDAGEEFVVTTGRAGFDQKAGGADAVTFALLRTNVINQWAARESDGWQVFSDWVVTFPTKHYYVDAHPAGDDVVRHEWAARADGRDLTYATGLPGGAYDLPGWETSNLPSPFSEFYPGNGQSCDRVRFRIFDREEFEIIDPVFSPAPSGVNELCREVNVVSFGATPGGPSNVLSSQVAVSVNDLPGPNGWMELNLARTTRDGIPGNLNMGLPVVGFSLTTRVLGDVGDTALNDAFLVDHAYKRPAITYTYTGREDEVMSAAETTAVGPTWYSNPINLDLVES